MVFLQRITPWPPKGGKEKRQMNYYPLNSKQFRGLFILAV